LSRRLRERDETQGRPVTRRNRPPDAQIHEDITGHLAILRREMTALTFQRALIACCCGVIAFSAARLAAEPADYRWAALALLACVGSWLATSRVPGAAKAITVSDTFVFLAVLLGGVDAGVVVAALATSADTARHAKRLLTAATNVSVICCSFFLSGWAVQLVFGDLRLLAHSRETFFVYALALALFAAAQAVTNGALVLGVLALRSGASLPSLWRENYRWFFVTYFSGVITAGVVDALIHAYGFWAALFTLPLLFASYLAYRPYIRNIEEAERHLQELQESEARFRRAFDYAPIGMALAEPSGRLVQVNRALCEIVGYEEEELLGRDYQSLIEPAGLEHAAAQVEQLLAGLTPTFQTEQRCLHRHGHTVWALWSGSLTRDAASKEERLIFQIQDITDRKRAEERLAYDAFHDALTGLPNRALFLDHLKMAMERSRRHPSRLFAVLFLDLDRFKVVNDGLGHTVGDQLLVSVARRLESCLRPGDTVARLGGDEFTVLLEDIGDRAEAVRVAERIHRVMAEPHALKAHDESCGGAHEVFTTASIGIAESGLGYEQPEEMLRDADTAMYRAKAGGAARQQVFDRAMHSQALSRLHIENDLRRAVERREFRVFYQPIVALGDGRLCGFEALARWQHPERGLVAPAHFIPAAEETGLILQIGDWVMREACRQMREWQRQFPFVSDWQMSVNLSSRQFAQPDLPERVERALREAGLEARALKLEITETVVMEHIENVGELLRQLRALGLGLSLDDFGTGYSSLSYLHRFPLNTLKIDRSFVMQMGQHSENREIVRTIAALAKNLGLDVVAEGVETAAELAELRALACEYGQGFYFSKPVDEATARSLIQKQRRWEVGVGPGAGFTREAEGGGQETFVM
jgi:diguanylate cyclase (GGDEF)-like protein/PAS domain S-box-containing protein